MLNPSKQLREFWIKSLLQISKHRIVRGLGFFHTEAYLLKFPVRDQFPELKQQRRHSSHKCVANIF